MNIADKNNYDSRPRRYAGLHLSGSNASKTAMVVLEGRSFETPLVIRQVYEKIGSFGSLFSDERLLEALVHTGPFDHVFTDCPLTVPPCVACTRPVCPGAVKCEDVAVAVMLNVSNRLRSKGGKRSRPVNPQSQRLWDVLRLDSESEDRTEPSYSANLAPLVARARSLQRRLNAVEPKIVLKETSVASALETLRPGLRFKSNSKILYRNFENGRKFREQVMTALERNHWIQFGPEAKDFKESILAHIECFEAFICALVGALHSAGLTANQPAGFIESEGWVFLPDVSSHIELPTRYFE